MRGSACRIQNGRLLESRRMRSRFYIITAVGVVLSFVGGFWLANSLNKAEISTLQANQSKSNSTAKENPQAETELPEEEIRKKLEEAANNPKNFGFQKNLGLALYRYAASKGDVDMLVDVETLLKRANGLNPDDYEVLVSLANVNFDLGQLKKDEARNENARQLYTEALKKNPKDANVIADLGISYLESQNPNPEKAIARLEEAYAIDPRSERILVSLSSAYMRMENREKANDYFMKLKEINPNYRDISQLDPQPLSGATK